MALGKHFPTLAGEHHAMFRRDHRGDSHARHRPLEERQHLQPAPAATAKPKRPASQTPLLPFDTVAIRAPRLRVPGTSVHGEATS